MTNNFFTCWLLIPGHILWIDMSLIRLDVFFYIWYRFRGQWDTPVNYMNKFLVLRNVITCARFCLKQMWRLTKAIAKMKCEHWTKRWNWSGCTKLALSASWTHGLIAQSVRVSERNSVVVGSNISLRPTFYSYF